MVCRHAGASAEVSAVGDAAIGHAFELAERSRPAPAEPGAIRCGGAGRALLESRGECPER